MNTQTPPEASYIANGATVDRNAVTTMLRGPRILTRIVLMSKTGQLGFTDDFSATGIEADGNVEALEICDFDDKYRGVTIQKKNGSDLLDKQIEALGDIADDIVGRPFVSPAQAGYGVEFEGQKLKIFKGKELVLVINDSRMTTNIADGMKLVEYGDEVHRFKDGQIGVLVELEQFEKYLNDELKDPKFVGLLEDGEHIIRSAIADGYATFSEKDGMTRLYKWGNNLQVEKPGYFIPGYDKDGKLSAEVVYEVSTDGKYTVQEHKLQDLLDDNFFATWEKYASKMDEDLDEVHKAPKKKLDTVEAK